ncbi:REP-associated tyrosine transposase [Breznakiella homolactica]|uniref:Transposase n=1 Tax=Breznakiella homolactica TaxID=2798577 RepID=A0A7T7XN90_9SPIR|nr:transposase [Breznakiella homolactica]QQO09480.1 transposase [Breznakiella homolactica]
MRKPRVTKNGATYHITVRANRKEIIMYDKKTFNLFVKTIERAKQKYSFDVFNFCLMGNHVHIIIRPGVKESISRIMQWILSVFARAWNKIHNLSGHVWGERFYSKMIDNFREFTHTFEYLFQNPVRAKLSKYPEKWKYSGIYHFLFGKKAILGDLPPFIREIYNNLL